MIDRILESPLAAVGFVILVIWLGGMYLLNRERSKVARMRGPKRFQPDWRHSKGPDRRRKGKRGGSFSPGWSSRRIQSREERKEPREDT